MEQTLEITNMGPRDQKPDVSILVPHDGSHEDLSRNFPDLYNQLLKLAWDFEIPKNSEKKKKNKKSDDYDEDEGGHRHEIREKEKIARRLITTEQDVFATQAAMQIAEQLLEKSKENIHIQIIKVLIPRAILDMNRVKEKAVWHTFNHTENQSLVRSLLKMYAITFRKIMSEVRNSRILLDLHTMSPYDPIEKIEINPKNIHEFTKSWRYNPNAPRPNDILSRKLGKNGELLEVGDPQLVEAMSDSFQSKKIPFRHSGTYQLTDDHLSTQWAGMEASYIGLDITKDNGSKQKPGEKFKLDELTFDADKLKEITIPIAAAIGTVLKQRLKKLKSA